MVSDGSTPSRAQMPIQPPSKDTEEMEAEGDSAAEMNGEEEESEEERSGSQTESEEESSEMDDEDYERRRSECLNEMLDLEKQFSELKEKLFRERLSQLRVRLEEVGAERAPEYTEPLGGLQQSLRIRIEVAGLQAVLWHGRPPVSHPVSLPTHGSSLIPALPMPQSPFLGPGGPGQARPPIPLPPQGSTRASVWT